MRVRAKKDIDRCICHKLCPVTEGSATKERYSALWEHTVESLDLDLGDPVGFLEKVMFEF